MDDTGGSGTAYFWKVQRAPTQIPPHVLNLLLRAGIFGRRADQRRIRAGSLLGSNTATFLNVAAFSSAAAYTYGTTPTGS